MFTFGVLIFYVRNFPRPFIPTPSAPICVPTVAGILNDKQLLLDAVVEVGELDVQDCAAFLASSKG